MPTGGVARRARRTDPERRDRLIAATLDVLAEHGVAGTTHRRIAAAADVPLGSLTYHFTGLDDLLSAAFTSYVALQQASFAAAFDGVADRGALLDLLVSLARGERTSHRHAVLGFELHLAALRDPVLRALTRGWTLHSRQVLAAATDEPTAAALDALLEGCILQSILDGPEVPDPVTRAAITRVLGWSSGLADG